MLQEYVSLIPYSNYKIGGSARFFFEPKSYGELERALRAWPRANGKRVSLFVLGGGTNLLISDEGFDGFVVKPTFHNISAEGTRIRAEVGVLMSDLLEFAIAKGLSGLEWAGGLPGTLGGAIRGNAGAFGGEIKDATAEVKSVDISGRAPKILSRKGSACHFNYRTSVFKEQNGTEIVLSAVLLLKRGDRRAIREATEAKVKYREERHPLEYPNIGSIFKNVDWCAVRKADREELRKVVKLDPLPVVPAAYLIAQAGLKGVAYGGAEISPKHPNFIVNVLEAKAADVKQLIKLVKVKVKEKYGVALEEEVMYV